MSQFKTNFDKPPLNSIKANKSKQNFTFQKTFQKHQQETNNPTTTTAKTKYKKHNNLRHTVFTDKNVHKTKYDNPYLRKNRYYTELTDIYVPRDATLSPAVLAYKKKASFLARYSNPEKSSNEHSLDSFHLIKTIGKGSFGRVLVAILKKQYNVYAIKMMSKEELVKMRQVKQLLNERAILSACEHPNIIKLNFSFKDNTFVYLVTELACNGDLYNLFIKRFDVEVKNGRLKKGKIGKWAYKIGEKEAKFYAANIFLALEYLHINDVIYRDLKPENILVGDNGYLKLTDFGFAKRTEEYSYTLCGTPEYMSPEVVLCKPYGKSVDWWSYGVFIYELVSKKLPFSIKAEELDNKAHLSEYYTKNKIRIPDIFSSSLADISLKLLEPDPAKRLGSLKRQSDDIRDHSWFREIDWIRVYNQTIEAPIRPNQTIEKILVNDINGVSKRKEKESEIIIYDEDKYKKAFNHF